MKAHLLIAIEPLHGETTLQAMCGEEIPNAQAVPLSEFAGEQSSSILFCKKCFSRQYFYVIATGQEAKDLETVA